MLAVVGSVGTSRVADLEAENVAAHEIVPLDDLLIVAAAAGVRGSSRVYKTTERVTAEISAVGVKLSSKIVRCNIDEVLLDETNNLEIVRSLHKLNTLEGTGGYETTAVTGFGAPGDLLSLRVTDGVGTFRGSPEAEI